MATITELPKVFDGIRSEIGFKFKQLLRTKFGYIYKVTGPFGRHFEVFERKLDKNGKVLYPDISDFGKTAFLPVGLEKARKVLNRFEIPVRKIIAVR